MHSHSSTEEWSAEGETLWAIAQKTDVLENGALKAGALETGTLMHTQGQALTHSQAKQELDQEMDSHWTNTGAQENVVAHKNTVN